MARKSANPQHPRPPKDADELSKDRGRSHGDWIKQAELEKKLKHRMRQSTNWGDLDAAQSQALEAIQMKISRVLEGNQYLDDHWDDIAGYALLGKRT